MSKWRAAVSTDGFRRVFKFVYRRREIALFRLGDEFYAVDNICTHEYSQISEGMVVDNSVYCPKHGSRFDIKSGAAIDLPATQPLKTFPVKVEDDMIYIKC